jgi:hypothetical protein
VKFFANGTAYDSIDQLPPEARAKYEQAMASLDRNQNGMPDFVEAMLKAASGTKPTSIPSSGYPPETPPHASRLPMPASPTITPDTSNGWMLALAALAVLFVCAVGAAGVWYFFLR